MEVMEENVKNADGIMYGKMGIKQVYKGSELIYERTGAYIYIELNSDEAQPRS